MLSTATFSQSGFAEDRIPNPNLPEPSLVGIGDDLAFDAESGRRSNELDSIAFGPKSIGAAAGGWRQ